MKKVRVRWPRFCAACAVGNDGAGLKINHSSFQSSSDDDEAPNPVFSGGGKDGVSLDGSAGGGGGNRVMVVVDSSLAAEGALEWALSLTVQSQDDTIVLLHVAKPSEAERRRQTDGRARELLRSMKSTCQKRRPGVQVEVVMREGKNNKGPIIVEEAKRRRVSLLVIGQRKRPMMRQLSRRWSWRGLRRGGVVEYCVENANCMTVGVRRKSSLGGYLITTKRHKNFGF
ncbi:Usp domain-containing protein [Psidium guajava]|nr:Usp domain-containing protein [Psidium guajava]